MDNEMCYLKLQIKQELLLITLTTVIVDCHDGRIYAYGTR